MKYLRCYASDPVLPYIGIFADSSDDFWTKSVIVGRIQDENHGHFTKSSDRLHAVLETVPNVICSLCQSWLKTKGLNRSGVAERSHHAPGSPEVIIQVSTFTEHHCDVRIDREVPTVPCGLKSLKENARHSLMERTSPVS